MLQPRELHREALLSKVRRVTINVTTPSGQAPRPYLRFNGEATDSETLEAIRDSVLPVVRA